MKRCVVWTIALWLVLVSSTSFALDHPVSSLSEPAVVTILVDAAHGGKDPGAVSAAGVREKDLSLAFAQQIGYLLEAHAVRVLYTREDDRSVPLQERTELVLESRPDILVSIHMNATLNQAGQSGFSLLVGDDSEQAKRLGWEIEEQLRGLGILHDEGIRIAQFIGSDEMGARPSVVLEVGYITNPDDVVVVSDPGNQTAISLAAVSGILAWLSERESQPAS